MSKIAILRTALLALALGAPVIVPLPFTAPQTAAQTASSGFVKPPRSISDITAILEQQKPDPARAAKVRATAEAQPPAGADNRALATFYFQRGVARNEMGLNGAAIEDLKTALNVGAGETIDRFRILLTMFTYQNANGDLIDSLKTLKTLEDLVNSEPGGKGRLIGVYRATAGQLLALGNQADAEAYVIKTERLFQELQSARVPASTKLGWTRDMHFARARLMHARSQLAEAEKGYRAAIMASDELLQHLGADDPARATASSFRDAIYLSLANTKGQQGRLAEAEADIRVALLSRLKTFGKYSAETANTVGAMVKVLTEQSRGREAEQMARTVIEILREIGTAEESRAMAQARNAHAVSLGFVNRWQDAVKEYEAVDAIIGKLPTGMANGLRYTYGRINAFSLAGKHDAAIATGTAMLESVEKRLGPKSYETAMTRGYLGLAQLRAKQFDQAFANFKDAVPILTSASRESDDEESGGANDTRVKIVVESYISMMAARSGKDPAIAAEAFRLADRIRGGTVHKALAASSARATVKDPALAELARKEQDLEKAIGAQFGTLNNALALPPEQRDDKALRELRGQIDKMRTERARVREEIEKKFPDYAALIDPRPPSIDDIRKSLRPNEAFVSIYLGGLNSFAWALSKDGPIAFTATPHSAAQIEEKVNKLRLALEPKAETLEEIPAFDTALAHEIYALFLKPIEAAWKPAKSLVLTTNGALGLLPLGLLPTEPVQMAKAAGGVMFEEYKSVPWLAKTHAVAMIPSASALKTLRSLPAAAKNRETLIGFGDPFFSPEQAKEAGVQVASATATATRGTPLKRRNAPQTAGVDSAELAMLPRLPDTADELKSIAGALQVDAAKALFLGREANEKRIKGTNLSGYKIVAFATHGLVPGELDGLTQPALALTAPAVAGIDGDGLLTMEDILALRLDADWVVLSACNTGAGSGAGAEAASGLGRAFFYAGTRALLVTNWSVHSVSARELVTDLFARQTKGAGLSRAEALREAMMALMEGPGFVDGGKSQFSYAHPLFWAPYSLIGDGGAS